VRPAFIAEAIISRGSWPTIVIRTDPTGWSGCCVLNQLGDVGCIDTSKAILQTVRIILADVTCRHALVDVADAILELEQLDLDRDLDLVHRILLPLELVCPE
jgi:hypothetical protein